MLDFKKKLINTVIDPNAANRSSSTITGKVLNADENSNMCEVSFTDYNGIKKSIKNMHVQLYNKHIIDWFPKVGDVVTISSNQGNYIVTGPSYKNGYNSVRSSLLLKEDTLSSTFNDFMGGVIF